MGLLLSALLATMATAQGADEYVDAYEKHVQSYVAGQSKDGVWTTRRDDKILRLRLDSVDRLSVTRVATRIYTGLVRFKAADGNSLAVAEFTIDLAGDLNSILASEFLSAARVQSWLPKPLMRSNAPNHAIGSATPAPLNNQWTMPAPVTATETFPELSLVNQAGDPADVRDCTKNRCAIIYVEPWSPSVTELLALRGVIESRGVPVRFVVGSNSPQEQLKRAKLLGPTTLIDVQNKFDTRGGLPRGFLIDDKGQIYNQVHISELRDLRKSAILLLRTP